MALKKKTIILTSERYPQLSLKNTMEEGCYDYIELELANEKGKTLFVWEADDYIIFELLPLLKRYLNDGQYPYDLENLRKSLDEDYKWFKDDPSNKFKALYELIEEGKIEGFFRDTRRTPMYGGY